MNPILDTVTEMTIPFGRAVERKRGAGKRNLQPLSVYLDAGVVPRSSRDDNYNRLSADLGGYLVVEPGDIVFNKLRTWQGGLGMSKFHGIVSPAYFVCRPAPNFDSRFLHYLLRSSPYLAEFTRISKFMPPSQFDILWDELRLVPIPNLALAKQRAIANFLDTETARIDALITKKRRLIDLLTERKSAAMLAGVSGQLTHSGAFSASDINWLDTRPSHWREGLLRLLARTGSGHTPSRDRPDFWIDCSIPWITTGEVAQVRSDEKEEITRTRECISELGLRNSAAVVHPKGTVALCRTASAGYSAIMGNDMATSQDFATWTCGPLLRPRFLLLCLRAMRPDLLGRLAMGSTHQTIYMPDIYALRIPVPPVQEQDVIVTATWAQLRPLFMAILRLREQIALLQEHRQALITAAVTGEIEVPGAAA